jgi:hypothetical protein
VGGDLAQPHHNVMVRAHARYGFDVEFLGHRWSVR